MCLQSAAFRLMQEDSLNFLKGMPPKALTALRKQVIEMVLGTDMKQVWENVEDGGGVGRAGPSIRVETGVTSLISPAAL